MFFIMKAYLLNLILAHIKQYDVHWETFANWIGNYVSIIMTILIKEGNIIYTNQTHASI